MASSEQFHEALLSALRKAKILGVRAGGTHRFTDVWVVVVEDRVFFPSWDDQSTGWYRVFRKQTCGSLQITGDEVPVRARHTRSERLRGAVTKAYGEKYNKKASLK